MVSQNGLVNRLKPIQQSFSNDKFDYFVSYSHPLDNLRVLKVIVDEKGEDHKSFLYTKFLNEPIGASDDARRVVFAANKDGSCGFRYYKEGDIFYVEDDKFKKSNAIFPNMRPIESSRFEEIISEFANDFFHVFQQDTIINGYLDTHLKYFKDDFTKLGGFILPAEKKIFNF